MIGLGAPSAGRWVGARRSRGHGRCLLYTGWIVVLSHRLVCPEGGTPPASAAETHTSAKATCLPLATRSLAFIRAAVKAQLLYPPPELLYFHSRYPLKQATNLCFL